MTPEFWITIAAIVLGPIIAVFLAQQLQKSEQEKQKRLFVFRTLMTTRRMVLSPDRVQALNLIEVEFSSYPKVMGKFRELLAVYNDVARWKSDDESVRKKVLEDVDDKTAELLGQIGKTLGYKLNDLDLLRGGYAPEAFGLLEQQQAEIREFLAGLNRGDRLLPVAVVDYRHSEKLLEQARDAQVLLEAAQKEQDAS
ncbi:hypothetical protein BC777_0475 [Yoonia maricola]|uniref:DUF6680 domain-containing protein n=1 Tax=Yoonia maricola TaxID=420999 RepID=A0A2M8WL41_9RHOB|nr:DUF6680 family protein [Yoonia maricola]PJI91643.1 hypothetical protein BC777_0475 [Yoonia maricola]